MTGSILILKRTAKHRIYTAIYTYAPFIIAQSFRFYDAKDSIDTKFRWDHSQQGRQIAFVDQSISLPLRLTTESLCPSAKAIRVHDGALAEEDAVLSTTLAIVTL